MSLPYVKIKFANGAIGGLEPMDDGVCALLMEGLTAVTDANTNEVKFAIGTAYRLTKLADIDALGVTGGNSDPNKALYEAVRDFYREAAAGSKLWIMGLDTTGPNTIASNLEAMQQAARGEIRIAVCRVREQAAAEDDNEAIGITGLAAALQKAAEDITEGQKAPLMVIVPGDPDDDDDLSTGSWNRVCVVMGDGNMDCYLAGRLASIPVQRSAGRVRDGAIYPTTITFDGAPLTNTVSETLNKLGYIVPRTFVGRAGYFWSDDKMAVVVSDDYALIPRRRVIDKAARVAYTAMLNYVNEEIPVTAEGKITAPMCKAIEASVRSAIVAQMTDEGNLATDTSDPNDVGCTVYVDPDQNILATSELLVQLRVRPYGYAKYIEVNLGFETGSN